MNHILIKESHIFKKDYDYRFIKKELAKEFEGEFNCLGKNTESFFQFL